MRVCVGVPVFVLVAVGVRVSVGVRVGVAVRVGVPKNAPASHVPDSVSSKSQKYGGSSMPIEIG